MENLLCKNPMMSKRAYAFLVSVLVMFGSQSPVAADNKAIAQQTSGRAVVVFEGGGSAHAFTTSWDACNEGRPMYVQELIENDGNPSFSYSFSLLVFLEGQTIRGL